MKIAVIGATGFVGSAIVNELKHRGHQITAIARNTDKLPSAENVTAVKADINKEDELINAVEGHDTVISSYNAGWTNPNLYHDFIEGSKAIQDAVKKSGVKRFIVIGGAGSLYIDGKQLVDSPDFPADIKP